MHRRFMEPTDGQLQVIEAMVRHFEDHGVWPTHREIAAAAAINSSNVRPYLDAPTVKGLAERIADAPWRNVRVTDRGFSKLSERKRKRTA